ncbi:MAG: monovalent cation/H+ antiporter subunit D family protein [Halofilum sp. (in: g-proteobacteria)]|nr:monovalent cation/H+ antiporter subunit D family protein [Halofilum sp. (in: g-proteobacteria)]
MSVLHHLPVLQVALPMLAAPVCAALRSGDEHAAARAQDWLAWAFACAVSWLVLVTAAMLYWQVRDGTVLSYAVGGWDPPWGIELRVDTLNALVVLIVSAIGALTTSFARRSILAEVPARRRSLFYAAWMLCLTGLLGIAVTGDAFNLFVFLEISSLSSYVLIAMGRDRRALTAAFQYLIMGTIGATFLLIGVGLLYMMTGTLNMHDLAGRLPALAGTRTIQAAFAFLTVGISLKVAVFPLHLWLPNAYAYAPSAVSALLAATATKVALYALLRFAFTVFGPGYAFEAMSFQYVLLPLSLVGIVMASVVAIFQADTKRLLAYSSVAQIGYMTLGISLASITGVAAAILHLFNHALIKGALFLALGCVVYRVGSCRIDRMAGLGREMPWTMAAFVIAGLSLIGVPLTAGFVSKWYLVLAAVEQGYWPVAAIIVIASLLAAIYIWRVVESAYLRPAPAGRAAVTEAPLGLVVPTWVLAAANLYFGLDTALPVGAALQSASQLLGVLP